MMRPFAIVMLMAMVAGCGQRADLRPEPGTQLPPARYGSDSRPTAEQLLELDPLAAPNRNVELRERSEVRENDPFDLPPEV